MREHRPSSSEGGGTNTIVSPDPNHLTCLCVGGPCLRSPMEAGVFPGLSEVEGRPRGRKAE